MKVKKDKLFGKTELLNKSSLCSKEINDHNLEVIKKYINIPQGKEYRCRPLIEALEKKESVSIDGVKDSLLCTDPDKHVQIAFERFAVELTWRQYYCTLNGLTLKRQTMTLSYSGGIENDEVEIIEQAFSDYACEYVNAIVHSVVVK